MPPQAADGTSWIDLDDADPFPETDTSTLLTATDVAMRVARRFCDDLGTLTQYRTVSMPVRPEQGRAPKYILVLFTRNDHGVWYFADALGRAGRHWQRALHEERARANAARLEAHLGDDLGLFDLDDLAPPPPPPFDFEQYERDNRDRWETTIAANLHRLFATHRSALRLVDHIDEVYGNVLGQAWERHVRAAVKRLHKSGLIADDGKHEFWNRPILAHMPRQGPAPPTDNPASTAGTLGEETA